MGIETLCGGLTMLMLVISGGIILLGAVGLVLLRLGVIGAYLVKGKDDRGESQEYALNQSHAPAETTDDPPADEG